MRQKTYDQRFWEKVDIGEPDECWPWKAGVDGHGYGVFVGIGPRKLAHRVAFELTNGATDLLVLHKCDNPSCCNPAHLFAGSHQDNMDDMFAKGRQRGGYFETGENHVGHRLTEVLVKQMRREHAAGRTYAELADDYGYGYSTIRNAVLGITWRHV